MHLQKLESASSLSPDSSYFLAPDTKRGTRPMLLCKIEMSEEPRRRARSVKQTNKSISRIWLWRRTLSSKYAIKGSRRDSAQPFAHPPLLEPIWGICTCYLCHPAPLTSFLSRHILNNGALSGAVWKERGLVGGNGKWNQMPMKEAEHRSETQQGLDKWWAPFPKNQLLLSTSPVSAEPERGAGLSQSGKDTGSRCDSPLCPDST